MDKGRSLTVDVSKYAAVIEEAAARSWELARPSLAANSLLSEAFHRAYTDSVEAMPGDATRYTSSSHGSAPPGYRGIRSASIALVSEPEPLHERDLVGYGRGGPSS